MMTPWTRAAILVGGIFAWFLTQKWIASKATSSNTELGDRIHEWTAGWNQKLHQNPNLANALLITSSLGIDLASGFLFYRAIFSENMRVLVSVLMLFTLRQVAQGLTSLPPPRGLIWRHPGFPSLLVTYGVANDLFFSGHTALAVLAALELSLLGTPWAIAAGVFLVIFEVATVLALRAHWTMDVLAGVFAATMIHFAGLYLL
ncbi:MAG: phosphatase PAP2 family protein [Bdellovibrionales bacterium]|nr:phosphatase PAP2 family protein [Bdellovibrionales bacterium]